MAASVKPSGERERTGACTSAQADCPHKHTDTKARVQNSGTSATSGGSYGRNIWRIQNSAMAWTGFLHKGKRSTKIHLKPFLAYFILENLC